MRDPRPDELDLPEFEKVWQAIKGWDIQRTPKAGRSGATGTDVITILDALGITKKVKNERLCID
jgi:hypothetical protein